MKQRHAVLVGETSLIGHFSSASFAACLLTPANLSVLTHGACPPQVGRNLAFHHLTPAVLEPDDHPHGIRPAVLRAAGGGGSLRLRARLEEALRRLGVGLAANPSVRGSDMLQCV